LFPGRFHILRYEDVIRNPSEALSAFGKNISIGPSPTLAAPSWNGQPLREVYPWGTIRVPTSDANLAAARSLSATEIDDVGLITRVFLKEFDYHGGVDSLSPR
jgi:hypothetical protein